MRLTNPRACGAIPAALMTLLCGVRTLRSQSPAPIARCESLLVSQQTARANTKRPYFLQLHARDGAQLTYFGTRHTFDPADTQFVSMQREFSALKPTIVFFEGSASSRVDTSAADAVRKGEEPGLARFLARTAGVPTRSLEPPRDAEVASLLQNFSAEDLVMFYTLRPMEEARDREGMRPPRLDTLFARQLAYVHKTGLENALADTTEFRAAFARKYPGIDALALPADWFNPALLSADVPKRLFNAINYASSMFRDVYMYRQLASAMLDPNARVFAEVGRDHIPAQAAALQCVADAGGT